MASLKCYRAFLNTYQTVLSISVRGGLSSDRSVIVVCNQPNLKNAIINQYLTVTLSGYIHNSINTLWIQTSFIQSGLSDLVKYGISILESEDL